MISQLHQKYKSLLQLQIDETDLSIVHHVLELFDYNILNFAITKLFIFQL